MTTAGYDSLLPMSPSTPLPDDIEALKAALLAERARADAAQAANSDAQALVVHLKLQIEKLRRELYGPRSERTARLLDQMELQLEELEAAATEDRGGRVFGDTVSVCISGCSAYPLD